MSWPISLLRVVNWHYVDISSPKGVCLFVFLIFVNALSTHAKEVTIATQNILKNLT